MTPEQSIWFAETFDALVSNVGLALLGKEHTVRLALTAMVAEGHLLLEDAPGTGKTSLAKALAATVQGSHHRIQFTPDLLPSDVTGVTIYDQSTHRFEFHPGPIFASVVLADEINRASPKTQAALLEVMEEGQHHGRRRHAPGGPAVHGDRDAEPDRAGGHLPPARGAAGPVPHQDVAGLPGPRVDDRDPGRRQGPHHEPDPADHHAGGRHHGGPRADRAHRRRRARLRRAADRGDARRLPDRDRRERARRSRARAHRQGVGGRGRAASTSSPTT